ncbi:MerR family transcriptional regulator [Oceanobacillus manasiensis]|uniref:MerR family transcriptional regulator n=1 Tax=Oceanobacillus manasiensis TaxID=586413 RepID=UPI0005AB80DD|nr:MerR family transcriptional regulator [Oceanobacillus manasiensis]
MSTHTYRQYYIKEVAELTGLSKQVIRKWEDRYRSLEPKRKENGYRVYSQDDIHTLLKIKDYQQKGESIQQAVNRVHRERATQNYQPTNNRDMLITDLLKSGENCDDLALNRILRQAYHYHGLDYFLKKIVIPFLVEVGNKWERGEWEAFQESVTSLVVRDFLVEVRNNFQCDENAPLILGACLPGELHEVPVHIILLQCLMKGWKTKLIGSSPAPGSIEALVCRFQPKRVLLSATTTIPFEQNPELLKTLDNFAGRYHETSFYLGGQGAISFLGNKQLRHISVTDRVEDVVALQPSSRTAFPNPK